MKAVWHDRVIAQSDATRVVERNHYFPADAVDQSCLRPSSTTSVCGWKGTAQYYDVVVGEEVNKDAAWYYPEPKPDARQIAGYIAFWRGVQVIA